MKMSQAVASWELELRYLRRSPRTVETYLEAVALLGDVDLSEIDRALVLRRIVSRLESVSGTTANKEARSLHTFFVWAESEGLVDHNPMAGLGTDVAVKARACGMRIMYTKRNRLTPAEESGLGADYRSLIDLFRESDFVVVTTTLTQETKGMIDADLIAMMKPSAILINTSRGLVVDEAALEQALVEGRIRGAGLDVYHDEIPEVEVPGPSERMKALPNVVLSPHIGTAARETREEMAMRTVENIERFLDGLRPLDVLNPEVYGETATRDERIG